MDINELLKKRSEIDKDYFKATQMIVDANKIVNDTTRLLAIQMALEKVLEVNTRYNNLAMELLHEKNSLERKLHEYEFEKKLRG